MNIHVSYYRLVIISLLFSCSYTVAAQEPTMPKQLWSYETPQHHIPKRILIQRSTPASPAKLLLSSSQGKKQVLTELHTEKYPENAAILSEIDATPLIDVDGDLIWELKGRYIYATSLTTKKRLKKIKIPEGMQSSALEVGFGGTPFIADQKGQKLYVWDHHQWQLIAEGDALGKPTALLRIGGALYIGTETDLRVLNLRSRKITMVADGLHTITAIAEDHIGYLVVLAKESEALMRVSLSGDMERLPLKTKPIDHLHFNPTTTQLITIHSATNQVIGWDYFTLIKASETVWAKEQQRLMRPFVNKDYVLSGSEYLIHTITARPEKKQGILVLQGFYPEQGVVYQGAAAPASASPQLIACAEKSFKALQEWLQDPPVELQTTIALGIPPLFWMMTDDYSNIKSKQLAPQRAAQLWYWKRNPAVHGRVPGYWKWEAILTQNCDCKLPDTTQIQEFLKAYIRQYEK